MANTRTICVAAVPWLNDNRGPEIVAALTILTILATLAVVLRFIARKVSGSSYGVDDWLILFTLVWEYGLSTIQYLGVHWGFGRHLLLLDPSSAVHFGKLFFAAQPVFLVANAGIKFSVLFFYHRIFPIRKFTMWSIAVGAVVIAWFIAFVFGIFFACRPLAYQWDKSIKGRCLDPLVVSYFLAAPADIATNFALLALPIPWLWGLQMPLRRKIAITFIFVLGSFASLGSVLRIPFLKNLRYSDVSYTSVNSGMWLNVEIAIGIVSANLPLMRPLFSRAFTSQFFSRFAWSRGSGSHRLRDGQLSSSNHSRVKSLKQGNDGNKIYAGDRLGGSKSHRKWYTSAVTAIGGKSERGTIEEGSQEDMVPMGKIHVKHDVELEQEDSKMGGNGTSDPHMDFYTSRFITIIFDWTVRPQSDISTLRLSFRARPSISTESDDLSESIIHSTAIDIINQQCCARQPLLDTISNIGRKVLQKVEGAFAVETDVCIPAHIHRAVPGLNGLELATYAWLSPKEHSRELESETATATSKWNLHIRVGGREESKVHEVLMTISWNNATRSQSHDSGTSSTLRESHVGPDATYDDREIERQELYPTIHLHNQVANFIEGAVHASVDMLAMETSQFAFSRCERVIGPRRATSFKLIISEPRRLEEPLMDSSPRVRKTYDFNAQESEHYRRDRQQNDEESASGRCRAFIALGSNIGNRIGMIEEACIQLGRRGLNILRTSSIYETEPMYKTDQTPFINGVCEINTILSPIELLHQLKDIEKTLGRVKTVENGPRSIDLDILLYGSQIINEERLQIPHPRISEREFVLRPLCE
ncbi:MAG: hypothetical protein Q9179_007064 [Wetmoreana sp. 5 TL-2023]